MPDTVPYLKTQREMPQGAYTLMGIQTHKQITIMEYDLCWNEDVYKV